MDGAILKFTVCPLCGNHTATQYLYIDGGVKVQHNVAYDSIIPYIERYCRDCKFSNFSIPVAIKVNWID